MKKIIFFVSSLIVLFCSIQSVFAQNRGTLKPFVELQTQYEKEDGKYVSVKPVIDSKENQIDSIDLYIGYDPKILQVIDASDNIVGVQVDILNNFTPLVNEVDERDGIVHVSLRDNFENSISPFTMQFQVIAEGKVDVQILNTSKLYQGNAVLSFQSSHAVISQIINDYKPYRFSHIQSTFLGAENVDMPITASFYTDKAITDFVLQYKPLSINNEVTEWREIPMQSQSDSLYQATIPAQDVRQPGLIYCFSIHTENTFLTVPRPCTLGNAYTMKVVDAELLFDEEPPIITFDPVGGDFSKPVDITLSLNEDGVIYCTDNGNFPTEKHTQYTGTFTLKNSANLKCFAVDIVGNRSDVFEELYSIAGSMDINFYGDPETLPQAGNVVLHWEVVGAEIATIDNGIGDINLLGQKVVDVARTTTYTLTAKNGSQIQTKALTINVGNTAVVPTEDKFFLNADKLLITSGEEVTLSWQADNMSDLTLSPDLGGVDVQGMIKVHPIVNTTYILSGMKNGEYVTTQVSIQVALHPGATPPITGPGETFLPIVLAFLTTFGVFFIKIPV